MYETFVSFTAFDGALEHTILPSAWKERRKRMNQSDDPMLARLQYLRFLTLRAYSVRDQEMRSIYWRRLPYTEQCIIEEERDSYHERYKTLFAIEMTYIAETKLDAEVAAIDSLFTKGKKNQITAVQMGKMSNFMDSQAAYNASDTMTENDFNRAFVRLGLTQALVPHGTPWANGYESNLMNPGKVQPDALEILPLLGIEAQQQIWNWFDIGASTQSEIYASHLSLSTDLYHAYLSHNQLTGVGATDRTLLVNQHIPLPTLASFLGWYSYAGIALRRTSKLERDRLRSLCLFEPTHVMTYSLPSMPMTKEHKAGGLVQDEASQADHSLGVKSAGHRRVNGRIDYGVWLCTTILFNPWSGKRIAMATETYDSGDRKASEMHDRHMQMIPYAEVNQEKLFYAKDRLDVLTYGLDTNNTLNSYVHDPYSALKSGMSIGYPQFYSYGIDVSWRSMSKFNRTHFRFDNDVDTGIMAANRWADAFEAAACEFLRSTRPQRFVRYFDAMMRLAGHNAPDRGLVTSRRRKDGSINRIDISGLFK